MIDVCGLDREGTASCVGVPIAEMARGGGVRVVVLEAHHIPVRVVVQLCKQVKFAAAAGE